MGDVPIHPAPAAGALDKAGQQVAGLPVSGNPGVPCEAVMYDGEYLVRDDGFMGPLYDNPFAFINWRQLLCPVGNAFVLTLHQIPNVYLVLQD